MDQKRLSNHIRKFKTNEQFLNRLVSLFPEEEPEWKTTVLYYTLLHLLRSHSLVTRNKQLPNNHSDLVKYSKKLKKFINDFTENLHDNCDEVRYDVDFDPHLVHDLYTENWINRFNEWPEVKKKLQSDILAKHKDIFD